MPRISRIILKDLKLNLLLFEYIPITSLVDIYSYTEGHKERKGSDNFYNIKILYISLYVGNICRYIYSINII